MTDQAEAKVALAERIRRESVELVRFLAGAAVVYLAITTLLFRTFYIPSSSMEPTLEVSDRVLVLNFIYGWSRHSLPFGLGAPLPEGDGRILGRMPARGDVVVFRHPDKRQHLIKRVIAVPGDVVRVDAGRVYLNDELVPREMEELVRYRDYRPTRDINTALRFAETLPGGRSHRIYERAESDGLELIGRYDDAGAFTVPDNRLFVMGDNRDESEDSRSNSLSYVPVENVVGKAVTVLFTLKRCKREPTLQCPSGRVWRPL
ncbi:MAG: signal peptidase I [Caulobacterales bacterium]|nr:signal peptidase I [Caulobacterales bacterium]